MNRATSYNLIASSRRRRAGPFVAIAVLFLLTEPAPALAQAADPSATRSRLEQNRALLEQNRERAGTIKSDLERLGKERDELDQDLIRTAPQKDIRVLVPVQKLGKLVAQKHPFLKDITFIPPDHIRE